jgi:hypothetical protein
VSWLTELAKEGHPIGNHTYDHVNVLATRTQDLQFRFQRAPWLIEGMTTEQVIRENVRLTTMGLKHRAGIDNRGFRTPGGFSDGLTGREDIQQLLLDAGFRWVSSKYPPHANSEAMKEPSADVYADIVAKQKDAQPFVYPTGLIEIPMNLFINLPVPGISLFRSRRSDFLCRSRNDSRCLCDAFFESRGIRAQLTNSSPVRCVPNSNFARVVARDNSVCFIAMSGLKSKIVECFEAQQGSAVTVPKLGDPIATRCRQTSVAAVLDRECSASMSRPRLDLTAVFHLPQTNGGIFAG